MTIDAAPASTPNTPSSGASEPAAPAAQPAQPAPTPAAVPEVPERAADVHSARNALFGRPDHVSVAEQRAKLAAAGAPEGPGHHSARQPRDEGRFAGPPEPAKPEGPAPAASEGAQDKAAAPEAGTAAPGSEAAQDGPKPETGELPDGKVRIEIPEGHALRSRGRTEIVVDKADEDYHRWAINNAIRRETVVEAQRQAQAAVRQWEDHAAGLSAQLEAVKSYAYKLMTDPSIATYVADNRRAYGEAGAERAIRGLWAEAFGEDGEIGQAIAAAQQQRAQESERAQRGEHTNTFLRNAFALAKARYPLASEQEIAESVKAYGAYVDASGLGRLDVREWAQRFGDPTYLNNPKVREQSQARLQQLEQQKIEQAKAEERKRLAEAEQERLTAANARRAGYPFAKLNMGTGSGGREVPADDGRPTTVHDARRALYTGTAAGRPR